MAAVDRRSKHRTRDDLGWNGFNQGDRSTAVYFGLRRRVVPWRRESWVLLACAMLKMKSAKS